MHRTGAYVHVPITTVGLRLQTEPMDVLSDQAESQRREATADRAADHRPVPSWLHQPGWAVAAVLLIGFNLRPSTTTAALFLADIKRDLGVSAFAISVLTMLPVILAWLVRARGAGAGPALRVGGRAVQLASRHHDRKPGAQLGIAPLYLGTMLVRASLCFLGVLTPALVKRDFRSHRPDDGELHHDDLHRDWQLVLII
jgi:hypothetical protein